MKIFITGHNGFIGSHMVERLEADHELTFLTHDLRDHGAVRMQLLNANPDVIVHLAARTEVQDSFYEQITFSEINYVGTVNLIEAAKDLAQPAELCVCVVPWKSTAGNPSQTLSKHGRGRSFSTSLRLTRQRHPIPTRPML